MYTVETRKHDNSNETITIYFNPHDLSSMVDLMNQYAYTDDYFHGENENGERVRIGIWSDHIECNTYQENGWIRNNVYWFDGTTEEFYGR